MYNNMKSVVSKKKNLSINRKIIHCFFLWMIAFNTHLDLIGKLRWIRKMTYNVIKYGLANTLAKLVANLSNYNLVN